MITSLVLCIPFTRTGLVCAEVEVIFRSSNELVGIEMQSVCNVGSLFYRLGE